MLLKNEVSVVKEGLNCANEQDFKIIYKETMSLLFKISFNIVSDEEAAEDLVHDSYIKANEKGMIFPTIEDAKYWLICVVKNASLNYAKRKLRESKAYHKALLEGKQHDDSGEVLSLRDESKDLVVQALNKLPQKLRDVIILKEYADMNYKEIGDQLGISEGNVKIRVFRAREALLKILGEEDVYLS